VPCHSGFVGKIVWNEFSFKAIELLAHETKPGTMARIDLIELRSAVTNCYLSGLSDIQARSCRGVKRLSSLLCCVGAWRHFLNAALAT